MLFLCVCVALAGPVRRYDDALLCFKLLSLSMCCGTAPAKKCSFAAPSQEKRGAEGICLRPEARRRGLTQAR